MPCPHTETCEMYGQFVSESFLRVWKIRYCDKDKDGYSQCVRYQKSLCGERVAINLLPNGKILGE